MENKKKITNIQMLNIWGVLDSKYKNTNDIKLKWFISDVAKDIYDIKFRFDAQKNAIIEEFGQVNEDGLKALPLEDEHIQQLFSCESEVSPIPLEYLDKLNLSFEEMILLKPIVEI